MRRVLAILLALCAVVGVCAAAPVAGASPAPGAPAKVDKPGVAPLLPSAKLSQPKPPMPNGDPLGPSRQPAVKAVRELIGNRTAAASVWQNSDGSRSVHQYLTPHFYRPSPTAGWMPIDTNLAPSAGRAGWWQTRANSWSAAFGPAGGPGGFEQVTVGSHTVGFAAMGVRDGAQLPAVSGSSVTYANLWPNVTVTDTASSTAVKEDLVITGSAAPSSFTFTVVGATARPNNTGGLDLIAEGQRVGVIPPVTVSTASLQPGKVASGARMTVSGDAVTVSVSPRWLAGLPKSAFPVVIDPFFQQSDNATQAESVSNTGAVLNGVLQDGYDANGVLWHSAVYVPVPTSLPAPDAGATPWQLTLAQYQTFCMGANCSSTAGSGLGIRYANLYGEPNPANVPPTFTSIANGQLLGQSDSASLVGFGANATRFILGNTTGAWFGMISNTAGAPITYDPSQTYISFNYASNPPPTTVISPVNGRTVSTTTPTLTAQAISTASTYDFVVSTAPGGAGVVIDSGWVPQASWTVPAGSLQDGVIYYATVLDSVTEQFDHSSIAWVPPAPAGPAITFQVKKRLGAGGPSPTDTIGAPPNSTSTPSQGAPSPGTPPSSETVDRVTGNLAVTVGTQGVQAVGGTAKVTLNYNSSESSIAFGSNYGLLGQYFVDSGNHVFPAGLTGQRTDPTVNRSWSSSDEVIGGISAGTPFLVRWTGVLTVPSSDTWSVGGLANSGGMRIFLDGSTTAAYDNWSGTASTTNPAFGTSTVNGGTTHQIEVDAWSSNNQLSNIIQLWAKDTTITDPNTQSAFLTPANWLTPTSTGLPPGWTMSGTTGGTWSRADDKGTEVIVHASSGDTATFTRTADGRYQPPPGNHDLLSVNGDGRLQLATASSQLYTFNPDGSVASMTTVADDRHPAALQYTYGGNPSVLRTITDPVSNRAVTLSYGGDSGCPTVNPAPTGILCAVNSWDGTATTFGYNGNGQLAQVTSPGNTTTLLGYDSDNRLAVIQDALANDIIAGLPGGAGGCTGGCLASMQTQIVYDTAGRVYTVSQSFSPQRTYTYNSGSTDVSIAGFTPSSGHATRTQYDTAGRILYQENSVGAANGSGSQAALTVWDSADQPIASIAATHLQTSTVYDNNGNVTDVYGPVPWQCFEPNTWPSGISPGAPLGGSAGYLPVANPLTTSGCGVVVPHTHNGYDEGITGLAETFWSNGQFAGPAAQHGTGPSGSLDPSFCGASSGVLCAQWPAGSPPVATDPAGGWSLRLTGTFNLAAAGTYPFGLSDSQPTTLSIDNQIVLQHDPSTYPGYQRGQVNTAQTTTTLSAGTHTVDVDFAGSASQLSEFVVETGPPGGALTPVSTSILDPNYGLKTSTVDPDGKVTAIRYADGTVGPEYGLPTATVTDPAGLALTSTISYEPPSPSTYLRKLSTTLPAGNATTYTYYSGTGGPLAAVCGVAANVPQGGQVQSETDPAPSSGAPAREQQFVYDSAGRQVGHRIGPSTAINSDPWECTTYDARGRLATQTWPATATSPARTVTHTYAVGGHAAVSSVSDSLGANNVITSSVDTLGRIASYTDATGKTTKTSYNRAGQVIGLSGPQGTITNTYDPNSGQLSTVALNGTTLATATYDNTAGPFGSVTNTGRLTGVTYANGTTASLGYDAYGNNNSLTFTNTTSKALVAGNTVTRSSGGRITSELQDTNGTSLTNANPAGSTATDYTYDTAGRLASAYLPGAYATYGYGTNPASDNCANPGQGANTNRTSVTVTPTGGTATTTDSCYNNADQLVATSKAGTTGTTDTSYAYSTDGHGNQTTDNTNTLTWDASDRLATTTNTNAHTVNAYDPVDRLLNQQSTASGKTTNVAYAYAGFTDVPAAVLDANNNILQAFISLPGGVTANIQTSGNTWSYPDLHGNNIVLTDNNGSRTAGPTTYDPWGQLTAGSTPLHNAQGVSTLGPFGTSGKLTDTTTNITILGARPYNSAEGRFLTVDPVRGGCANEYVYAFGDPLNQSDLTGRFSKCISAQLAIDVGDKLNSWFNTIGGWNDFFSNASQVASSVYWAMYLTANSVQAFGAQLAAAGRAAQDGSRYPKRAEVLVSVDFHWFQGFVLNSAPVYALGPGETRPAGAVTPDPSAGC